MCHRIDNLMPKINANSITINSRMSNRNIHIFHKYFKILSLNEVHKKENSIYEIRYWRKGYLQVVVHLAQSARRGSKITTHGEFYPIFWSLHPWNMIIKSYIILYIIKFGSIYNRSIWFSLFNCWRQLLKRVGGQLNTYKLSKNCFVPTIIIIIFHFYAHEERNEFLASPWKPKHRDHVSQRNAIRETNWIIEMTHVNAPCTYSNWFCRKLEAG